MANHIRDLFETLQVTDDQLRTVLVPPPIVDHKELAAGLTEEQRRQLDCYTQTLIQDIVTPLVAADKPIPFFILSASLDALHRLTISPAHAFFLSLFLKTAIRKGLLYENLFVDAQPVRTLIRLCGDLASPQQYGVPYYNQLLCLEAFINLLFRDSIIQSSEAGGETGFVSPASLNVMDVFCQTIELDQELFEAVAHAYDAVVDAISADMRQPQSQSSAVSVSLSTTGLLRWSPVSMSREDKVNASVTVANGKAMRMQLLYLHGRLSLRTHQPSAQAGRLLVPPVAHASISCPYQIAVVDPNRIKVAFQSSPSTWHILPRHYAWKMWGEEQCNLIMLKEEQQLIDDAPKESLAPLSSDHLENVGR